MEYNLWKSVLLDWVSVAYFFLGTIVHTPTTEHHHALTDAVFKLKVIGMVIQPPWLPNRWLKDWKTDVIHFTRTIRLILFIFKNTNINESLHHAIRSYARITIHLYIWHTRLVVRLSRQMPKCNSRINIQQTAQMALHWLCIFFSCQFLG